MWGAVFWFAAAAGFLLDVYVDAYTVNNATSYTYEVYDCEESLVAAFGSHLEAVAYVRDALLRGLAT